MPYPEMTKAEWAMSDNAMMMLMYIEVHPDKVTLRQVRLIRAACCTLTLDWHDHPAFVSYARAHEDYAESRITHAELKEIIPNNTFTLFQPPHFDDDVPYECRMLYSELQGVVNCQVYRLRQSRRYHLTWRQEIEGVHLNERFRLNPESAPPEFRWYYRQQKEQGESYAREDQEFDQIARLRLCGALRDIVNPFSSGGFSQWRTASVRTLASEIATYRSYDRMPELGALLEDEGCGDTELLLHCMNPTHSHGCYVLDALY